MQKAFNTATNGVMEDILDAWIEAGSQNQGENGREVMLAATNSTMHPDLVLLASTNSTMHPDLTR